MNPRILKANDQSKFDELARQRKEIEEVVEQANQTELATATLNHVSVNDSQGPDILTLYVEVRGVLAVQCSHRGWKTFPNDNLADYQRAVKKAKLTPEDEAVMQKELQIQRLVSPEYPRTVVEQMIKDRLEENLQRRGLDLVGDFEVIGMLPDGK